jgi:hypothetical protein
MGVLARRSSEQYSQFYAVLFHLTEELIAQNPACFASGVDYGWVDEFRLCGTRFLIDFAQPAFRLGIEVQGGIFGTRRKRRGNTGHTSVSGMLRDMRKANAMVLRGWSCLYYTPDQLFHVETFNQIRSVIILRAGCNGSGVE